VPLVSRARRTFELTAGSTCYGWACLQQRQQQDGKGERKLVHGPHRAMLDTMARTGGWWNKGDDAQWISGHSKISISDQDRSNSSAISVNGGSVGVLLSTEAGAS
jgi:hypothetical protein